MNKNNEYNKYIIFGEFIVYGIINKEDFINSIFRETKGLISKELNFDNLKKEGKIKNLKINLKNNSKETKGNFKIKVNLSKVETSMLAASLETVKKIKGLKTNISIRKIEDLNTEKKNYILKRASVLLNSIEESGEYIKSTFEKINNLLESKQNIKKIKSDEIILVKRKEDALNLLKNGFDNVFYLDNKKLKIKDYLYLSKKILILFIKQSDKRILNKLRKIIDIDYFVFSPNNKEIFNLNKKELEKALIIKNINTIKPSKKDILTYLLGFEQNTNKKILKIIDENIRKDIFLVLDKKSNIRFKDKIENFSKYRITEKDRYLIFNGKLEKKYLRIIEKNNINIEKIFCKSSDLNSNDIDIITFIEIF